MKCFHMTPGQRVGKKEKEKKKGEWTRAGKRRKKKEEQVKPNANTDGNAKGQTAGSTIQTGK